jgi:hypothetical protein
LVFVVEQVSLIGLPLLKNFFSASLKNGSGFRVKILPFREPCLFHVFVLVLMIPLATRYKYYQNRVDLILHRAEAPKLWSKHYSN